MFKEIKIRLLWINKILLFLLIIIHCLINLYVRHKIACLIYVFSRMSVRFLSSSLHLLGNLLILQMIMYNYYAC